MKSQRKLRKNKFWHPRILIVLVLSIIVISAAFWLQLRGPRFVPSYVIYVCMVEDRVYDYPLIQISVEGNRYSACKDHKEQMLHDAVYKTAVDPLTYRRIDKSRAFLWNDHEGKAFYFENRENSKEYVHRNVYGRSDPHRGKNP